MCITLCVVCILIYWRKKCELHQILHTLLVLRGPPPVKHFPLRIAATKRQGRLFNQNPKIPLTFLRLLTAITNRLVTLEETKCNSSGAVNQATSVTTCYQAKPNKLRYNAKRNSCDSKNKQNSAYYPVD